jgi:hypothetical protein
VVVRLEPQDEYLHPLGPEPTFNESMYFNVFDPSKRLGGFFRLGNRPNEGYAEMTVCLYLADGRVAFMFQRPPISSDGVFDAGGLRFEVIRPFEELDVSYTGRVVLLDNPLAMAEPRDAFANNPHDDCTARVTFRGVSTMFGGEPTHSLEAPGEEFARGHYEQLTAGVGTVSVGSEIWELHGYGLRDHSWGPRSWQATLYYRWLTANFGPTFGFMGSRIARREGPGTSGGFVWDGTALHRCRRCKVSTTWTGSDSYHDTIDAVLTVGERDWHAKGRVLSLIPLRNRREGRVTRISEGLTEWTLDDGRIGYGLSEYLDQMIDGKPAGRGE